MDLLQVPVSLYYLYLFSSFVQVYLFHRYVI